jgi:hypothetical protein
MPDESLVYFRAGEMTTKGPCVILKQELLTEMIGDYNSLAIVTSVVNVIEGSIQERKL